MSIFWEYIAFKMGTLDDFLSNCFENFQRVLNLDVRLIVNLLVFQSKPALIF